MTKLPELNDPTVLKPVRKKTGYNKARGNFYEHYCPECGKKAMCVIYHELKCSCGWKYNDWRY